MKVPVKFPLVVLLLSLSAQLWAGGVPEPAQEDEVWIYINSAIDEENWFIPDPPREHQSMEIRVDYSYTYHGSQIEDSHSFYVGDGYENVILQLSDESMEVFFQQMVINNSITIPLNYAMAVPPKESPHPYFHFPWRISVRSAGRAESYGNYRMDFIPWTEKEQRQYAQQVCVDFPYYYGENPDWFFQTNPAGDQVDPFHESFQMDLVIRTPEEDSEESQETTLQASKQNLQ